MTSENHYDVIVVGGGHNGLIASAYLAQSGLRTIVLERRDIVGGACVTEEFYPGFKVSTGADVYGMLRPQIIQDLKLKEFGLDIWAMDPQLFVPFPDGQHLYIWRDVEKTTKEIERFSRRDAKSFIEFGWLTLEISKILDTFFLRNPPNWFDITKAFLNVGAIDDIKTTFFLSIKDLIEDYFESPNVKSAMALGGVFFRSVGPMHPGGALGHFLSALHEVDGEKMTSGYVRGGMGGISEAISKSAKSLGVEIRTGVEVSEILVESGKAMGVKLADGTLLRSRIVVSNADPKRTFLNLVNGKHLSAEFKESISRIKMSGFSSRVICAVDKLPNFIAAPSESIGPQHTGYIAIAPSIDYMQNSWEVASMGYLPENLVLGISIQSTVDPTLAPENCHVLSIYVLFTPHTLSKGDWDEERTKLGERVLGLIELYAPGFKKSLIYYEVLTPADYERKFYLTGSGHDHGEMGLDQMFSFRPVTSWSNYSTPIKNLYLCGAGTHPGGGVTGSPGFNAAKAILGEGRNVSSGNASFFSIGQSVRWLVRKVPSGKLANIVRRFIS